MPSAQKEAFSQCVAPGLNILNEYITQLELELLLIGYRGRAGWHTKFTETNPICLQSSTLFKRPKG
jgi:hypothetical protein